MELPRLLRSAVDAVLEGVPTADLARAGEALSRRYRAETRDGRLHLSDDLFAKAYLAARLPATFAALAAAMAELEDALPDFAPSSLLDVGAGPGTALWAATERWPAMAAATLLEASRPIRAMGERLGAGAFAFAPDWREGTVAADLAAAPAADLVVLSYVLDELDPAALPALVGALWARTRGVLLVVEPGTPAGWRRILAVRERLLALGAAIAAPCAHEAPCPVQAPDWCHFARRVARTRVHLRTKEAVVPFEDEKFIYLAATRMVVPARRARILAPPRAGSGKVALKLCRPDGTLEEALVTKREGERFRAARRADWGDALG
ncbi:small ribosomal subunit Rsm22 family protein [Aureimonas pseudogalii]|uniref:Ribosomal protein RSM22 (Predicted rRNA methylase) n=1 Tax=Aureimonas pseudogalii TaxID=1744844 RepID=A0A7W6MLJ2_9HYPH|nr:small ribosomal subunit Rsm22 family protein [Aureimonas pseudogalii]MBB3999853.1 ribosomal protein RSM22 (predicted rRNA methylase) [Aureimonas pseudogalii]